MSNCVKRLPLLVESLPLPQPVLPHSVAIYGPERGERLLAYTAHGSARAFEVWDLRSSKQLVTLSISLASVPLRMWGDLAVYTTTNAEVGVLDHTGAQRTLPFSDVSDRLVLGRRLYVVSKEKCLYLDMDTDQVTAVDAPYARKFHPPRLLQTRQGAASTLIDLATGWRTVVPDEVDACCLHSGHLFYATHHAPMRGLQANKTVMIEHTVHAIALSDPEAPVRTLLKVAKPVRKHFNIGFMAPQPFEGHEPIVRFDDDLYTLSL